MLQQMGLGTKGTNEERPDCLWVKIEALSYWLWGPGKI